MRAPLAVALILSAAGCIRAPELVLVDRATALEEQAAGSFTDVEKELARATIEPHPMALTPDQLEALGLSPPSLSDATERTEADAVDDLLKQHCVGEGKDGLLVATHDACRGAADRARMATLIDRGNAARMQLWRWMKERKPASKPDDIRRAWTGAHKKGITCGGWLQRDDGTWEAKSC